MSNRPVRKPLDLNTKGCSPTSSNCVIWQGPDIPFLNLCKGATVTHVVYELAMEVWALMEQLNPNNYDLDCITLEGCPPETFQELFQTILCKIGNLELGLPCKLAATIISSDKTHFNVEVSGGPTGVVTYEWSLQGMQGNVAIVGATNTENVVVSFTGAGFFAGLLTVRVTDERGCTTVATYLATDNIG